MALLHLHGWNSVVGSVKPTYLKSHGHEVIEPALGHEDFKAALETAQKAFDQHQPDGVVGSSRVGAVAVHINSVSTRLVLMCMAWKNWGMVKTTKDRTVNGTPASDSMVTGGRCSVVGLPLTRLWTRLWRLTALRQPRNEGDCESIFSLCADAPRIRPYGGRFRGCGCRSQAGRRATSASRRGRHAPARVRPSWWADPVPARVAAARGARASARGSSGSARGR